jgi:hypothetical protein
VGLSGKIDAGLERVDTSGLVGRIEDRLAQLEREGVSASDPADLRQAILTQAAQNTSDQLAQLQAEGEVSLAAKADVSRLNAVDGRVGDLQRRGRTLRDDLFAVDTRLNGTDSSIADLDTRPGRRAAVRVVAGIPDGAAGAVALVGTWLLTTPNDGDGRRYRRSFGVHLPTAGMAEGLGLDPATALRVEALPLAFDALADGAPEPAQVGRIGDGTGLLVTLAVARVIRSVRLRSGVAPEGKTTLLFRTDGDLIAGEPVASWRNPVAPAAGKGAGVGPAARAADADPRASPKAAAGQRPDGDELGVLDRRVAGGGRGRARQAAAPAQERAGGLGPRGPVGRGAAAHPVPAADPVRAVRTWRSAGRADRCTRGGPVGGRGPCTPS